MPIYFSPADPSMPMQMVTAEDQANAQPMPQELIPQFLPGGVPMGFMPMLVGAAPVVAEPQAVPVQENIPTSAAPPTTAEVPAPAADKKKKSASGDKKSSSKKKVKSSKKKKDCC